MTRASLENSAVERAVLGALIVDPGIFWNERERLGPDLFASPLNRSIMEAITRLSGKGREWPIAALMDRIPAREEVSIPGYLATLVGDQADVQNAPDFISDLRELKARRDMAALGERLLKEAASPGDASAQERLERALAEARTIGEATSDDGDTAARAVAQMLDDAQQAYKRRGTDGIPWFLREIFQVIGDELEFGWLVGVMADSGGGKTSLALQQAYFTAKRGIPVLMLSGDQRPKDCYRQIAGQVLRITSGDIRSGKQSEAEFERLINLANGELRGLPLEIQKTARPKTGEIAARVRKFRRLRGRGLVILDHAGKVYAENPKADAGERFNQIFADCKDLAASTDCAFLALMQRNAQAGGRDNPRPIDVDIPGGPGVRQNFDLLIAAYFEDRWLNQKLRIARGDKQRDELERRVEKVKGFAEFIGMKARFGPEGEAAKVKWEARFTRYVSLVAQQVEREPELI